MIIWDTCNVMPSSSSAKLQRSTAVLNQPIMIALPTYNDHMRYLQHYAIAVIRCVTTINRYVQSIQNDRITYVQWSYEVLATLCYSRHPLCNNDQPLCSINPEWSHHVRTTILWGTCNNYAIAVIRYVTTINRYVQSTHNDGITYVQWSYEILVTLCHFRHPLSCNDQPLCSINP